MTEFVDAVRDLVVALGLPTVFGASVGAAATYFLTRNTRNTRKADIKNAGLVDEQRVVEDWLHEIGVAGVAASDIAGGQAVDLAERTAAIEPTFHAAVQALATLGIDGDDRREIVGPVRESVGRLRKTIEEIKAARTEDGDLSDANRRKLARSTFNLSTKLGRSRKKLRQTVSDLVN